MSDAGTLLFGTAPVIKTHPQDVSFAPGQAEDCIFTVEAEDPSKVTGYQWQRSTDGGETYQDLEDGKSAAYVIHAPTADMDGNLYRCVVSNKIGSVTSDAAALTSFRAPVPKPLQDLTYDVGDRPLIFVNILDYGNPRATLYEFQISTDGGKTFRNVTVDDGLVTPLLINDADGNTKLLSVSLHLWDLTAEMDGYMYRAALGNVYGGETHMTWTEPMTLHVIRNCEKNGHDWIDATCTAPKTCKACGATEGEALGHIYGAGWTADENNHWHACTRCGDHGDEAAHTPDREAPDVGVPVLCSVCGRTLLEALKFKLHDVNQDGVVDLLDVTRAQRYYGLSEGDEGWNPNADINGDGTVNIADLILILNNFFFKKA